MNEGGEGVEPEVFAVLIADGAVGREAEHELGESVAGGSAIGGIGAELAVEGELAAGESGGVAEYVLTAELTAHARGVLAPRLEQRVGELIEAQVVGVGPE